MKLKVDLSRIVIFMQLLIQLRSMSIQFIKIFLSRNILRQCRRRIFHCLTKMDKIQIGFFGQFNGLHIQSKVTRISHIGAYTLSGNNQFFTAQFLKGFANDNAADAERFCQLVFAFKFGSLRHLSGKNHLPQLLIDGFNQIHLFDLHNFHAVSVHLYLLLVLHLL